MDTAISGSELKAIQNAFEARKGLADVANRAFLRDIAEDDIKKWARSIAENKGIPIGSEIEEASVPLYFRSVAMMHKLSVKKVLDYGQPVVTISYSGGFFELLLIAVGNADYVAFSEIVTPVRVFDGVYIMSSCE